MVRVSQQFLAIAIFSETLWSTILFDLKTLNDVYCWQLNVLFLIFMSIYFLSSCTNHLITTTAMYESLFNINPLVRQWQ